MADEENPLGGGPFGVGPFGPLVGAAVAAVTVFNMAAVTTAAPLTRTLYYQAKIAPPPQAPVVEAVAEAKSFSITTGRASSKTLFYQARIGPPPSAPTVDNTVSIDKWLQPLSRPLTRPPTETALYTPFVPQLAPSITADKWLQPFRRQVAVPLPVHTQPILSYTPIVVVADVTPDQWLPSWRGPPNYNPAPQGGAPFVPKEAVLENTVTPDKWLVPFGKAVPVPKPVLSQPVLGYPYEAAANLTTSIEWLRQWQGPPRYLPPKIAAQPFVPKEAVLENTVTPDKWLFRFAKAVPVPKPVPSQPVLGYPYEAASNLTTSIEWLRAWPVPPRYQPAKIAAQPFVPREATSENTVTPDKWLFRFAKAVPTPKPVPSQPVLGYPYESVAIVVPYEQWWHQPLSRAPARPPVHAKPYQPFVPKEAVLENTQTPDKWLQRFAKAVPTPKPVPTQPAFVYPGERSNLTTSIEWLQKWQGPPRYRPQSKPYQPFVPKAAVVDQVTPDKWLPQWRGPPRYRPLKVQTPPFVPREATAENTVTPEKWLYRFQKAVPARPVTHTQPFFGYPYADEFTIGGPADEPERVVCVLAASRVATEPGLLRDAVVPVTLRTATVPELSRVVVTLDSSEVVQSNEYRDEPCPPFGNTAGIPVVGGVVTPEPEADNIDLESGDSLLLESGDELLLE